MSTPHSILHTLREQSGTPATTGISDRWLEAFADDPSLKEAMAQADAAWGRLGEDERQLVRLSESEACCKLQEGYANFYPPDTVNPYVSLGAAGPWIVTAYGAVLYDTGGYGMLGSGHNPKPVQPHLGSPQVMANVMTPSFAQRRFMAALRKECAHGRSVNPFERFACLNSGSESMTLALRISDRGAFVHTEPGGRYEGRTSWVVAMDGAFHGRTDKPARISDSSRGTYSKHLASHRERARVKTVAPNDPAALTAVFEEAKQNGAFVEAVVLEPVQGEGNPGLAMSRSYYDAARKITKEHGALLIVDAIQAGIRTYGCLSLMSAPGFTDAEVPDLETWSKALNAGQYPLSVLGMGPRAAELFRPGIYGNTMTTNPRALDVATAVLAGMTDDVRANIRDRGVEMLQKLDALSEEVGDLLGASQGTGLLLSIEVRSDIPVVASDGLERRCRERGLNVIHGGENSLRFTPHFRMTSAEVDLVVGLVKEAVRTFE